MWRDSPAAPGKTGWGAVADGPLHKADGQAALYDVRMQRSGELRVSQRGQMSLPAPARHRWGLESGGEVGYVDLGDAIVLLPGGVTALRRQLFDAVSEDDWRQARAGFDDPDLATE